MRKESFTLNLLLTCKYFQISSVTEGDRTTAVTVPVPLASMMLIVLEIATVPRDPVSQDLVTTGIEDNMLDLDYKYSGIKIYHR